jgi:hypothetical protein
LTNFSTEPSSGRESSEDHSKETSEQRVEEGSYNFLLYRWIEAVVNPRSNVEMYYSSIFRAVQPFLTFFTYRFHVEKARDGGKHPESNRTKIQ